MPDPPKRLLIVDDEEDLLFMAAFAAESTGKFAVEKARDGKDGLAKARRFRSDPRYFPQTPPTADGRPGQPP